MGGIPQGLILRPVLFNIFVSVKNSRIECRLSKIADIRLCGAVDMLDGRHAIQKA